MDTSKSGFRTAARLAFYIFLVLGAGLAAPARAQVMHNDGFSLPWFHTRAENLARQACEDNLPECRDSVRQKLVAEHLITTLAPWILLCLIILGAVVYTRRQEARRERRRHEAERQHVRAAKPTRNVREKTWDRDGPTEEDDQLGLGHPGDR